jgi:hypothetical protein
MRAHKHRQQPQVLFALCLTDSQPDLELGKVYQVLPDLAAAEDQYLRVIDESGEDYLYPNRYFTFLELPEEAKSILAVGVHAP